MPDQSKLKENIRTLRMRKQTVQAKCTSAKAHYVDMVKRNALAGSSDGSDLVAHREEYLSLEAEAEGLEGACHQIEGELLAAVQAEQVEMRAHLTELKRRHQAATAAAAAKLKGRLVDLLVEIHSVLGPLQMLNSRTVILPITSLDGVPYGVGDLAFGEDLHEQVNAKLGTPPTGSPLALALEIQLLRKDISSLPAPQVAFKKLVAEG